MRQVIRIGARLSVFWFACWVVIQGQALQAQETDNNGALQEATVPRVIQFSGVLQDYAGQPLAGVQGARFALYREQQGGSPLWIESQNVTTDELDFEMVLAGGTAKRVTVAIKATLN